MTFVIKKCRNVANTAQIQFGTRYALIVIFKKKSWKIVVGAFGGGGHLVAAGW